MIDIGINFFGKHFKDDKEEVLNNAKEQGVTGIILTGTNLHSSKQALDFSKKHPDFLYSTAGFHPHDAKHFNENTNEELKKLLSHPEVVAVGECGLDFDRNFSSKEEQFFAFEQQLILAKEVGKPLFLHERSAHKDFTAVMRNHRSLIPQSVVHCFTSNKYHLKTYLDMGFYIGITGWICDNRRGKDLQEAVKYIPLDRLMIETDSPYLTPKNLKPMPSRNEPKFLPHIAKEISRLMNIDEDILIEQVTNNTKKFFSI